MANSAEKLKDWLSREARALGFDHIGFAPAKLPPETGERLYQSISSNYHATMDWLAETASRRKSPECMWEDARTAIILAMNYGPDTDPLETTRKPDRANLSVYARNRDYHDIIKGKLKILAGKFAARTGDDVKVFVDTAPLMEKPLASLAGIGWQGKHTNLVSRESGSWLFLGAILTTTELTPDEPHGEICGSCRACLDACPTNAFPAPFQLDGRRCISYLTIEHKGIIDEEFRKPIGNRIYGCDDCLAVCPWNKYASAAKEMKLKARGELIAPKLTNLLELDDASFRKLFSGSPVKRIGRDRFMRNVLIAAGNSGDTKLVSAVEMHLADPNSMVRAMAVWALKMLLSQEKFIALREEMIIRETDCTVIEEWK